MSETFDAYYSWLGIAPDEQPPDHYRLLGVRCFESSADVIDNSADRQMRHVRGYQTGPHRAMSQRILNEISAARVCLLDPQKKAEYDRQLKAAQSGGPTKRFVKPAESPGSQSTAGAAALQAVPISPSNRSDATAQLASQPTAVQAGHVMQGNWQTLPVDASMAGPFSGPTASDPPNTTWKLVAISAVCIFMLLLLGAVGSVALIYFVIGGQSNDSVVVIPDDDDTDDDVSGDDDAGDDDAGDDDAGDDDAGDDVSDDDDMFVPPLLRSGEVYVKNTTAGDVTFRMRYYIDQAGRRQNVSGNWDYVADEGAYILKGDSRVTASKVFYTFVNQYGTRDGSSDNFDGDGDLYVAIRSGDVAPPGERSGDIYVENKTDLDVEFRITKYFDHNGREQTTDLYWAFEPKEKAYIAIDGNRIRARKVHFSFTSSKGTTNWNSDFFNDDGDLYISINPDELTPDDPPATTSGEVYVKNTTDGDVTFRMQYYIDQGGRRQDISGNWDFVADEGAFILKGDSRVTASKVFYTLVNQYGTRDGSSANFNSDGDLYIAIRPGDVAPPGERSGDIYVENKTDLDVEFRITKYFDHNGREQTTDLYWAFEPKEKAYIAIDGNRIRARKVHFSFTSSKGTTNWNSDFFNDDGDLYISINPDELTPDDPPTTRSGDIIIENKTDLDVEFRITKYYDQNGQERTTDLHWAFEPKERAFITDNGNRIRARKVHFSFTSSKGKTYWNSAFFDDDGNLYISINPDELTPD